MIALDDADAVPEDRLLGFDAVVRRQAALRLAERHAAARHHEAHADLGRGGDLVVDPAAILEDIGVVEHGGAARERQLAAADQHRGAGVVRRPAAPDPVMRLQPGKQVGVLPGRQVARQDLVEVVVAVDQAGQHDVALEVEHAIGGLRQTGGRADLLDHAVAGEQPGIRQLAALPVHRHEHVGILREQGRHVVPPELSAAPIGGENSTVGRQAAIANRSPQRQAIHPGVAPRFPAFCRAMGWGCPRA